MSTYPQLILEVISASDFDGDLVISPQVAAEEPGLGIPGKKVGDVVLVYSDTKRMTVSLGVRDKLGTSNIRKAGASAARWLLDHQTTDTALKRSVFDDLGIDNAFDVFCEGLLLGAFRFIRHKSKENNAVPVHVHILSDGDDSSLKTRVDRISALAEGVNLAREWSHEPPNIINPITLGERSRALAVETGLNVPSMGRRNWRKWELEPFSRSGWEARLPPT
jgi:leucyl aminopeptidase